MPFGTIKEIFNLSPSALSSFMKVNNNNNNNNNNNIFVQAHYVVNVTMEQVLECYD